MSDAEPDFTLQDLQTIIQALEETNAALLQAMKPLPFSLFIQGASPQTETNWLERQYLLPDAKVSR